MLILCTTYVDAQWSFYDTGNSILPNNTIRCITFDNDSVAWVGTDFGLAKIKNGNFTIYNTSNSGIPDNAIRCVTIDSIGRKWIGTFLGGFTIYNDTTWTNFGTLNSQLPDDQVKDIQFDAHHTTWLATTAGLVSIDTAGVWKIYQQFSSPLQSSNIARIYIEPVTDIKIVGTVNGGLSLVQDTTITTYTISNSGIADNSLYDIDIDAAGNYWMASPSNGIVVKVNGAGWANFTPFNSGMRSSSLTSVELDQNERVWTGTIDSGIVMRNGLVYTAWNSVNSPLTDNFVQCLKFGPDGKLWIGTFASGVFMVDTASILTSANEFVVENDVHVYPNPASDYLHVNFDSDQYIYEITEVTGKIISIGKSSGSKPVIAISDLEPGIYFFSVEVDGKKFTTRFIKK